MRPAAQSLQAEIFSTVTMVGMASTVVIKRAHEGDRFNALYYN